MLRSNIFRLRLIHLFSGMMFWYGIEQLFLDNIIHDASSRALVTIVFTATVLVFDIPGGVFADKFGRKLAVIGASLAQIIGLLLLGLSSTLTIYLVGAVIYGMYISLFDGASQALLYDTLAKEKQQQRYAKLQGGMYALFFIGAGIASFASGFMAHRYGVRMPYLLSLIPAGLALLLALGLREPPAEKQVAVRWFTHIGSVLREIRHHPVIPIFAVRFMLSIIVLLTIGEFGQIYLLAFHISDITLGLLWAAAALVSAGGRYLAHHLKGGTVRFILAYCVVLACFALVHNWLGILLFLLLYACNEALSNVAETEVQHATSSRVRATMFSVVNFGGNALSIPIIFLYNAHYLRTSIFSANRIIALLTVCGLLLTIIIYRRQAARAEVSATEVAAI